MGGNIYPNLKRIFRDKYFEIGDDICAKLRGGGKICTIPPAFIEKSDFGDIDVIIQGAALNNQELINIFGEVEISRNTNVVSILYRGCQCDLGFYPEKDYLTSCEYFSWNDASNFLGKLCHGLNYSLGNYGLAYHVRFSDEDNLGKITVSKDWPRILEFLDLEKEKWVSGFKNAEDLYKWVVRSKYFNKEKFAYENLNQKSRIREKKRVTYNGFIEWCKDKEFNNNFVTKNKVEHLFRGMLHFGCEWFDASKALIDERRRKIQVREIFSGADLLELGYSGKELGATLEKFKKSFDNFEEECIVSSKEEMIQKFKNYEAS